MIRPLSTLNFNLHLRFLQVILEQNHCTKIEIIKSTEVSCIILLVYAPHEYDFSHDIPMNPPS